MTAEIINLRQARKDRARAARETEAATNRSKFGRSKAERETKSASDELERRRLDAHKRDPDPQSK